MRQNKPPEGGQRNRRLGYLGSRGKMVSQKRGLMILLNTSRKDNDCKIVIGFNNKNLTLKRMVLMT